MRLVIRAVMMVGALVALASVTTGCGSAGDSGPPTGKRARAAVTPSSKQPAGAVRGAMGAPTVWIAVPGRSAWMAAGSTCWRSGCADMIAPDCRASGKRAYPGVTLRVRPGDPVAFHVVGEPLRDASVAFAPLDAAFQQRDGDLGGADPWTTRAPDADAAVMFSGRGTKSGGQASYVACLDVHGEPRRGASATRVADDDPALTRGEALLRFAVETNGQSMEPVRDSIQCVPTRRPAVSATRVWRCSALMAPDGNPAASFREYATIAANGSTENGSDRARLVDIYAVKRAKSTELIAVRGVLIGTDEGFVLCATAYASLPPSCGDADAPGALPLVGYDPAAHDLERSGSTRFSAGTVVVFGRMRGSTLVVDDAT